MRTAEIYCHGIFAGTLTEDDAHHYIFRYDDIYFADPGKSAISPTLPKSRQEYRSGYIFPFFSNMVAEGTNQAIQIRRHKLDERDVFSLLLVTAGHDSIGAVTVATSGEMDPGDRKLRLPK